MKQDKKESFTRRHFLRAATGSGALAFTVLLVGCQHEEKTSTTDQPTEEQPLEPQPTEEQSREAQVHTIMMESDEVKNYFEPDRLAIEPGDTVRWILESGLHSTTAYHPDNVDKPLRIPENALSWDSGHLSEKDTVFEHTFSQEGVYDYYCMPHEALGMVGVIVVGSALDGPGLAPPQDALPEAVKERLAELHTWAKEL